MALKVLTLNILHDAADWPARAERIGRAVDRLEPDVIGLQEVLRGPEGDQCGDLLASRGYHTEFAAAAQFWKDRSREFGNALAARWPMRDLEVLRLPTAREGDGDEETRCVLAVTVDAPFGSLPVFCTHLNWRFDHGYARERQVVALCDFVRKRRQRGHFPVLMLGDFNAEPASAEIRYVAGLQSIEGHSAHFRDAWAIAGGGGPGVTWSHENPLTWPWNEPDRRIDYIFVGPPRADGRGVVERCEVVCDREDGEGWASDHFGVCAEIRTEPRPAQEG